MRYFIATFLTALALTFAAAPAAIAHGGVSDARAETIGSLWLQKEHCGRGVFIFCMYINSDWVIDGTAHGRRVALTYAESVYPRYDTRFCVSYVWLVHGNIWDSTATKSCSYKR